MSAYGTNSHLMAAEAAAEIVSQKLEILLSRPDWVGCSSMETLVKDAKAKLAMIQEFFSTQDRPSKSTEWWGRFLQAMYHAEDILDKFQLEVACRRRGALQVATRPIPALVHKCMLWRDLSDLVKAMKELCQDQYLTDKKQAGGEGRKKPARSFSRSSAPWEEQKLARLTDFWDRQALTNYDCHKKEKQQIKDSIINADLNDLYGISIWGEQGSGKTFLARWVYGEAMVLNCDTKAWVHVSTDMDLQEFLFEILKQVDKVGRNAMNFTEIKEMLNKKLTNSYRFLIVLDDVRRSHEQLLEGLMMIINPSSSRGHIIITTQDETIAKSMTEEQGPIHLKNLTEREKKNMLAAKLHRGPHDESLPPIIENINLKRFPDLPLCISLLGGLLSCAKEQECKALANSDSNMSISDLLQLSYNRLPVHLKPCFIYMALFPVASPISTRRLVRLWLAEGLLDSHCRNRERKRTPEDVGETFILELADRNLIDVVSWRADGSPKACQMLTSLYDLICSTVMSTGFLHVHNAGKLKGGNDPNPAGQQKQLERSEIRWLAEHTNIVRDGCGNSFLNLNLGCIRSFLSFFPRRGILTKDISTLVRKMTSKADYSVLRVLDLEGVYKPSLQGVLRKLVLLRYLGLRSTVLDSIPSEVADLYYLETLDIKHTNITSLPSSLWKARNLRHLHLSWFYIDFKKILKVCGDNVMALTKLQTLGGLVIGEMKENSMTSHMNCLTTLTKLKLFLQHPDNGASAGETVARWINSGLTNLQSLTFGVIQEAKPAKKATTVAEPKKEAAEQAQPAEEPKPAQPAKAETTKEAAEVAKPTEEPKPTQPAKAETTKDAAEVAKPATSHIGSLPELSLARHHQLLELYLLGQLNDPIWTQLLPISLRVLTLSGSKVETDVIPHLGGLLRNLKTLRFLANSLLGKRMKFIKDGFPSLTILKIWNLPQLEEVIIDQGAMPHLKELNFRHLKRLTTVVGIHYCTERKATFVPFEQRHLIRFVKAPVGKESNLQVGNDSGDNSDDDHNKARASP